MTAAALRRSIQYERDRARDEAAAADPNSPESCWRRGDLAYKLHPHQLEVFYRFEAWAAKPPAEDKEGKWPRIFVMDIGRRWGKTYLLCIILLIFGIKRPKSRMLLATAFAKDIAEIVIPLMDDICADAPEDVRPRFRTSKSGESMGYFLPNGTSIKLVGIDLHPRGLRGRGLDFAAVTEAGYVKNLRNTTVRVVYPQFQRRQHARMILESNAPEELDHDFDLHFIPDAKERGAYAFGTIDDNVSLTESERDEFIRAAGGREHPDCQREYFQIRVRDPVATVVPEFDPARHIGHVEPPSYAIACVFQDPGIRDLFGLVWGYWHFELQMLVIQRSWAKRNAGTAEIAEVIAAVNAELWEQPDAALRWWDGPIEKINPAVHVSDTDARLIGDLRTEHGMNVLPADKRVQVHGVGEAKLYAIRNAFREVIEETEGGIAIQRPRIMIEPNSGPLEDHVLHARWNDKRTDLQRHPKYGHFDCLLALSYGWRAIQKWRNVNPTKPFVAPRGQDVVIRPNYVAPMSKAERFRAAITGKNLPNANRPKATRCPVCGKMARCEVWMNAQFVCSEACRDRWLYRNTGGKPPPPINTATGSDDEQNW